MILMTKWLLGSLKVIERLVSNGLLTQKSGVTTLWKYMQSLKAVSFISHLEVWKLDIILSNS